MALGRADVVLVTGGLGPTEDDITRDAIARLLGVPMVRHPEIEALLREKFAGYGRGDMPRQQPAAGRRPRGHAHDHARARHGARPGRRAARRQADLRGARRARRDGGDDGGHDPARARGARRAGDDRLADAPLGRARRVAGGRDCCATCSRRRPIRASRTWRRRARSRSASPPRRRRAARPRRCSRRWSHEVERPAGRRGVHRRRRGARGGGRAAAPRERGRRSRAPSRSRAGGSARG